MKKVAHFFLSLILLISAGCDDKGVDNDNIDSAYTAYVSAFTSGIISSRDVVKIKFSTSISTFEINEAIEDELFDFDPGIDGVAYQVDDRTIEFRPDEALPSGQYFKVDFDLARIMDVPDELETFTFGFQVLEQAVFAEFTGMKPYNDEDLSLQMVYGRLNTTDYAEAEKIEAMFTAEQEGNDREITWTHTNDGKEHIFQIDSVIRKEERSNIELIWDGDELDVDDGELAFVIPPLGEFSVMSIHVAQEPNQRIEIHFSDPLKKDQDLEGMIYLTNQADVRRVIESNVVYVYPQQKLVGDHTVVVEEFVVNSQGYQLLEGKRMSLAFTSHKPAIEMLGKGVIIPNSDGIVLPFKAVNLSGVDFKIVKVYENNITQFLQDNNLDGNTRLKRVGRLIKKGSVNLTSSKSINYSNWNTFYLDLSKYVETDPGAIYRVSLSFRPSHSLYTCEQEVEDAEKDVSDIDDPDFTYFDEVEGRWSYYEDYRYTYHSGYSWRERENPCHISYYLRGNNVVSRNILSSDLGIIAKRGVDGKLHAFVTDLKTSDPMSGVTVELYNYQQQLIASAGTDGKGMASIDLGKNIPFMMIARYNNQRGYLKLDEGTSRSISMFNVGGKKVKKGLKGFIYGERGVWRPGDSLYLSFILEDKLKAVPVGHPVVMELYTPENDLYSTKIQTRSVNGFYDFRTKTEAEAPTGNWTAKVKIGGAEFSRRIRIESIKPNRLKINLDFGSEMLEKGSPIDGNLHAAWLHGAKAGNLRADIEMSLTESKTTFKDYPGFYFDNPARDFDSEEKKVFDGNINSEGKATFTPQVAVSKNAPGMLNARFVTRVFERGGDFSIDRYDIKYSPYPSYVGVKIPEGKGWNGAIFADKNTLVPLVTVDQYGRPVSRKGLKIEVFKVNWRWWWEHRNSYDLSHYVSNRSQNLIFTATASTTAGKGSFEMQLGNRWGRYFIQVTDPVSGHSSGQLFYTTYSSWWNDPNAENPGGAEMLTFSTDKKEYGIDEDVRVNLPEFEEGRALVTLENASEVLDKFWVEASQSKEGFTFKTRSEMAPNVFVNITLVQPHSKKTNNLPMRMYGIEKIMVKDQNTILQPEISMSDDLEPEKKVQIKVTEKEGRKMTYTIAVVDDGLLDLTRFKTPDPWNEFYSLQALGVKTWDLYPYVLGDFGMNAEGLLAIGGDEALNNQDKKKANRFVPVVKFLGPFTLASGEENDHEFVMPNYVGSVRTMVVAGQDAAYGNAEFTSKVRKPVMILPTIPRVIGPGESFSLPVSVFAMDEKVKNVKVEIKTNDKFIIKGSKTQSVSFSEPDEKMVYFDVQAKEAIGVGSFEFKASGGGHSASYNVEIQVRPANPMISEIYDGNLDVGENWSKEFEVIGVAGTEKATLELTSLPPLGLEKHLDYLVRYPYGCIEQTTSSVFAQLYLGGLMELSDERKAKIQNNIESGIKRLASFQNSSGGLSYWPGEDYASEWGTNYAGHFMIEAREKGYALPSGFLKSWIKFQKQMANSWTRNIATNENRYSDLTQSYRLYTLAKVGSPALGAMNRMLQVSNLSKQSKWRLAGAYAILGKDKVAKKIIAGLDYEIEDYRQLSYTYGSRKRDLAMILEVMAEMDDPTSRDLLMDLANIMSKARWVSTQESAYILMAISKAGGAGDKVSRNVKARLDVNGKIISVDQEKICYQLDLKSKSGQKIKVNVKNNGSKLLFARIISSGIPLSGKEVAQSRALSMTTSFQDMSGTEIDPSKIEQGSDFIVEVRISNPGQRTHYNEMVLNQIFPSGWEIRNARMDASEGVETAKVFRYQDLRDDRVYTFFNLKKYQTKTFRITLNATYAGKFYLPAFVTEAMYDESISANNKGQWVEVVNTAIQ